MTKRKSLIIGEQRIKAGETHDVRVEVSETFTGTKIVLPVQVTRARRSGPVVFVTAAIHGDEVNGIGIIRQLLYGQPLHLTAGALVCVPVLNIFGVENHTRYMSDRRDLNRFFPGSQEGSLTSRFASLIMREIVANCDYGIDLHSAASRRTNFPNVRADLRRPEVRVIAEAFGCELLIDGKGPEGSFRRAACEAGCPTIVLEAGEIGKVEPGVVEIGVRGIRNVLVHLGMMEGDLQQPAYQTKVRRTHWVRASLAGLLRFHVAPGDLIDAGQPIATNESIFGVARSIVITPVDGIVLGMTTHPAVQPGEPICHLALPGRSLAGIRRRLSRGPKRSADRRVRDDLATSLTLEPSPHEGHRSKSD